MFAKKPHVDTKKSIQKVIDTKKDSLSRLKHLRIILENLDPLEAKSFFEEYYSPIYYIFYDVFVSIESSLKQRGHKTQREDFDTIQFTLEKILTLLPELLSKRWQCHSLQRIMKKFLHPGNSFKVRKEGIRLFIIWYQILGKNAPEELDGLFSVLVPGIIPNQPKFYASQQGLNESNSLETSFESSSTFYAQNQVDIGPAWAGEISPLMPPHSGEIVPENATRMFIDCLLEFMVTEVHHIEWREKVNSKQQNCFRFLFEKFRSLYLPHIFNTISFTTSLYTPNLELPKLRFYHENIDLGEKGQMSHKDSLIQCQSIVIRWVTNYSNQFFKKPEALFQSLSEKSDKADSGSERHVTVMAPSGEVTPAGIGVVGTTEEELNEMRNQQLEHYIVTSVLYSCREYINLVHELFRQAFLLPFTQSGAMRRVIAVYKDWIYVNSPEKPVFLEEPMESDQHSLPDSSDDSLSKSGSPLLSSSDQSFWPERNIRAGLQNMLQIFVTNAANVFLLEVAPEKLVLLEEQVDMCKRVLNIYRYMVMQAKMERRTWEQLLLVLLQVTSLVLKEVPPIRKEETLGGRLAPALFQTLIVTWIKANLNVVISSDLWNQFLKVLSSLTRWEELIKEWAKTMDTLTRVLARQVYNLDLNDLPLNRPTEQKQKKRRGMNNVPSAASSNLKVMSAHQSPIKITPCTDEATAIRDCSDVLKRNRCNSGDSSQRMNFLISHSDRSGSVHRSSSDSYLCTLKRGNNGEQSDENYYTNFERNELKVRSKSMDFINRAESPCLSESFEYRSRSPSPTPSSGVESSSIKDSPMQIDVMMSSADNSCSNSEVLSTTETCSVMAGGTSKGWLPEVAVVLWKRMLGALGDINEIQDPMIHSQVLQFLLEHSDILTMIRNNMGITMDNQTSPLPPELVPPIHIFTPWLFRAIYLPKPYEVGKLLAYRLLCGLTVRRHDIAVSQDYLSQFYLVLHEALVGQDQSIINTIVRYCGPTIFSLNLPGSTLLLMDFIYASNTILSSSEIKGMPRFEAVSTLSSLLGLLRIYNDIYVLQSSGNEQELICNKDAKDFIVNILIKVGKNEPAGLARCIAISNLGIYILGELVHETNHPRLVDAVNLLLAALRFNSRAVSQVACDMLQIQCGHSKYLLRYYPDIPRKIVEVIASTIMMLVPSPDAPLGEEEKKLFLSLLFCLGEWCISIPSALFCTKGNGSTELLTSVLRVLNSIATGSKDYLCSAPDITDLAGPDADPNIQQDNINEDLKVPLRQHNLLDPNDRSPNSSPSNVKSSFLRGSFLNMDSKSGYNVIRLAARSVMGHLINYLGHFPMSVGAAHLTSLVAEQDDASMLPCDELSSQVLHAPNVQMFILNNCSVLSIVEIPALEVPGGGATAGLATASSQVRVIVRDQSGKFSWDCSVLYGPPAFFKGSVTPVTMRRPLSYSPHFPRNCISASNSSQCLSNSNQTNNFLGIKNNSPLLHRPPELLPTLENSMPEMDNLDDLLQHIGFVSPECIPHTGNPLNIAPQTATGNMELETAIMHTILNQRNNEISHVEKHAKNSSMIAKPVQPPSSSIPDSPFQHCRTLLNQLGFLSWEKRPHIDLLQKNESLIRELKNLDQQKCRETHKIAVIYVGIGQEDKNSLLLNTSGSLAFEQFVSGLGWEVDLETHVGFMGGLQRNGSTGTSAPYYASSFVEVIFHVSTRMPTAENDDSLIKKLRHLGNDEVHIVWSEHTREYRRGIIATEFCDVLIVIYPMNDQLVSIRIDRKPEIPFFGPLFSGAIVDRKILPALVRATAINASRAKRSIITLSQTFFEERAKALDTIVKNQKYPATFEQFAANVYSPSPPRVHSQSAGVHFEVNSSRPASSSSTPWANALLDSHHTSNSRPIRTAAASSSDSSTRSSPHMPIRTNRERPLSASHSHSSSPLSQH